MGVRNIMFFRKDLGKSEEKSLKNSNSKPNCAHFGWDTVNVLHSSKYGLMAWICDAKSVDNIEIS